MSRIDSARTRRLPRINSTTRAIRTALFASTAALALAGAPAAFAGTCTQTAALEVTCTGAFTDTVNNSFPPGSEVPDLTLILDDGPTSVTPAVGVVGLDASWGGDVTVLSDAEFTTDSADAIYQYGSNTATLNSYGDISTYVGAAGANAIDINAFGDVSLVAGGSVSANSDAAYNVLAVTADSSTGNTGVLVDADGTITASAYDGDAIGVYAEAFGDSDVTVDGAIYAASVNGNAGGVISRGLNGNSTVTNTGYVGADAYVTANGVVAGAKYGNASVYNDGEINATAVNANGIAVFTYAAGDVYMGNTGTISAESGYADAIGMTGYAFGGDATVYNSGSISASGYGNAAGAVAYAFAGNASADNYGDISVTASGDTSATATGLFVNAALAGSAYNAGTIDASAIAADATFGIASATGVSVTATDIAFDNTGTISAYAAGYGGAATGVYLVGAGDLVATNSGDIGAQAMGALTEATGFMGYSSLGTTTFTNDGDIYASAEYQATGVWLASYSTTSLYNFGSIEAAGAAYNYAIDTSYGGSADYIYNQGTITGAIRTGAGDDTLYNGVDGVWNPGQTASTFGAGDDAILNYGTINMEDSVIDLGYHAVEGNSFLNDGVIGLEGDNFISMGDGLALLPALNPIAFVNDGVLDFQDGAPDDTLTITGDFAGSGDIDVDVSGLHGVSDMLYIDGSVVTGTANAINVNLLDLSQPIDSLIPIVYVTGDSVDGNFVLGDVDWDADNSFVNLDFGIVSDIDASNATSDVFSLGIEVTGLSDPGTIASAVAPGVQSLLTTQVGTWRQRMGVIDGFNKGAVSLWGRVFQDKGTFSPGHDSSDFGTGGNYEWDQRNRGAEVGVDFAVTDEFSLGLLAARSKADLNLNGPGVGEADLDADTWGVYGTWISPMGFYLDTSYRWTSFDVDLASIAGPMQAKGDAETFNIEGGYAWTLSGGLKIEPQLQYTKTKVDNVDVFTSSNGMSFRNDGGESSRGRAGVSIRKAFGEADNGWLFTPYATVSAVREFDGENSFVVNDTLVGRSTTEGTSTLVELGATARHQNWSVYGGLNWQDGGAMEDFIGGQLGVRYTFGGSSPAPAPVVVPAPVAKTCADLDDDGDGVNNCNDRCLGSTAGQAIGPDGCPVPAPEPEPVTEPKQFRG